MAKKRPEPEKSVDTDEDSDSGQEEEDASSDSEPEPPLTQVSRTQVSKKAPKKPEPSSEDSDSESEADSDSNPKPATTPTKKPRSKNTAGKPTSPTKSAAGTKRPAAVANGEAKEWNKSKKKKKSVTEDSKKKAVGEIENSAKTEDPKKQLFQRLWSEDDEIAVLKGMIEYAEEKNADPVADLTAFHDYIRESLQIDASRTQLQDKIRRLRKKYENNAVKEKKGKEITFSKRHDQNAYDLSKQIWGGHNKAAQNGSVVVKAAKSPEADNASARKERIKSANVEVLDDEEKENNKNVEGSKSLNSIGGSLFGKSLDELSEWIEKKKGWVSEEEMIEMEEKWKALNIAEVELFLKRAKLIYEKGKLVLDALKK